MSLMTVFRRGRARILTATVLRAIFVLLAFFAGARAFSFSADDIQAYTLENGLKLYVLSDPKTATVRVELDVYAGYSAQSEKTAGFFPLYARLLSKHALEAQTGADCVRLVQTVAPYEVEAALSQLSHALRPLVVSDSELRTALTAMKAEVNEYAESAAGFINMAIDARMFSDAPWKQESGVYPALFTAQTVPQARAVLEKIGSDYYTAKNAALFVSGNITEESALLLVTNAFLGVRDSFPPLEAAQKDVAATGSARAASGSADAAGVDSVRKYVLSDDAFSADITQIVLQYTGFSSDQADVLAAALNNDRSAFKAALLQEASLGILGAEYINVASAQKRGSSRLIVQSLLEKTKRSPCAQAEAFVRLVEETSAIDSAALQGALALFRNSFFTRRDSSAPLMELFASYRAATGAADAETLFLRDEALARFSAQELQTVQRLQKPAVFVLVNSAVYQKRATEFKKAGYTLVNRQNGSWYTQELHKARLASGETLFSPQDADLERAFLQTEAAAARFMHAQTDDIVQYTLTNGIPVTVKKDSSSQTVAIMLTIAGGELLFADKTPGLCTLLTDALSLSMRRHIAVACDITAETFASFSRICITCAARDVAACVQGAGYALIYSDITPAMADGIAYDERTQWRLKAGTTAFQLLCEAVRTVYGAPYARLFNDKDDKPSATIDFTRIATAYPLLLDASRYSLVVCGGISDDSLQTQLTLSFGVLESNKATESKEKTLAAAKIPKKAKSVKLRHLFLTDVSADKAGPRPAVLVPTKDFSDPLLYCMPVPALSSTDSALFNALLYELTERLQAKLGSASAVTPAVADDDIPFARITVANVAKTKVVDTLYAEVVRALLQEIAQLAGEVAAERPVLLTALENRWLMKTLGEMGTEQETARLMQTGLVRAKNARLFAEQYMAVHAATAQDYSIIAQAYLEETAPLRLYSADAK